MMHIRSKNGTLYWTDLSWQFVVVLLVSLHLCIDMLPIVAHGEVRKRVGVIWVEDSHEVGIGTTKRRLTEIVETVAAKFRGWEWSDQAAGA